MKEEGSAAQNEFDALVQKVKRISIQPFTPGQKAGILWAEGEIKRLREVVEDMDKLLSSAETIYGDGEIQGPIKKMLLGIRNELRRRAGL